MNTLTTRLLSLFLFAALCATLTYWAVTLTAREAPLPAAAAPEAIRGDDAAALFGGQLTRNPLQDIHLFGILALQKGAAAIVSTDTDPPHAVALQDEIAPGMTLAEVRARSIVISRNGVRSEVFLPSETPSPAIYML